MMDFDNYRDDIDDLRDELMRSARARSMRTCSDGYCGALDCPRCNPAATLCVEEEE